jgi:ABC-type Mn2+/Zn2+ transport system ATPase subunit
MRTAADPSEILIDCRAASFGYGGIPILTGLNLQVKRGDLVGIVGGNGSGKTTLFRGLLGLIKPVNGKVQRSAASIGYVPQREELDAVYPLTVREIVLMGASGGIRGGRSWWRSPSKPEIDRMGECLEFVDLANQQTALFASLSGGQRQRCLLARALMPDPDLLMLDEPTAGVDRAASEEILGRISKLHEESGIAVLMVAHQLDFVHDLAEEVIVVGEGKIQRGPVASMLSVDAIQKLFGAGLFAGIGSQGGAQQDAESTKLGENPWTS